ncbi:MAG: lipopolysaccharide heptosyltransferase I [Burkholderiales bacterium]|nr:lipopolysaccharide heptosyltransferase I [Burkholderiales bacterium]
MKILLVRVSSLGDVLHNMPIVDDLLQHYPEAQIDWVVEEAYVNLVKLNPGVRKVFPFALRRWRKNLGDALGKQELQNFFKDLRREEYDLVLETQGLLKTGLIMGLARIKAGGKKVGLANGTEGSGYEAISRVFHSESVKVDSRTHAVLRGRLVAAQACGYRVNTPASFGLRGSALHPAWMPAKPYAVFFHGTAGASKKWARSNWISIARTLKQKDLTILLPWGSAEEKAEAEQMAAQIPNATVLPQLSMQEATVLAQRAALAIGVDTGLTHIAAAYETPTIEIYCDSPRWKTEGNWSSKIINLGDQGKPASVGEVERAIHSLIPDKT